MAIIIGFVPNDTINNLPLGFKLDGCQVSYSEAHSFGECSLVVVSDKGYQNNEIRPPGRDKIAYLIQHKSNYGAWQAQRACLEHWEWIPFKANEYSRDEGGLFNRIISQINRGRINPDDLGTLLQDCKRDTQVMQLDIFAAWAILGNADMTRQVFSTLHEDTGERLEGQENGKEVPLSECLGQARENMSKLLLR